MDMKANLLDKLAGGVGKDQQSAAQAILKMHVLLVVSSKEEGKLADRIYDPKFTKISTVTPDQKSVKIPKDVHAIVAWCGKDDLTKIGSILDNYNKYIIKTIIGKQTEDVKNLQSQDWQYFEYKMTDDASKLDSLKQYLKSTFDKEVDKIKKIFEAIDEDGNKYLSPFELTLVSQQLGKPLNKEEIEECVRIIDSDGNGQITFDEFALWWIGGREGAPEGLGNQLANFMAKSQKFTNLAMRQLNQTIKTTQGLEEKDLRNFQVKFQVGKYEEKDSGITFDAKFGIVDSKQEPVLGYKETLNFNDKESWFMIKFHIDDDETPQEVLEKVKNYKVIQLLQKYSLIYNRQENVAQGKFEVKSDKKAIIIGLQGGHQLNNMKQNYISIFDPVFEKVIQLQKKSNLQNFYQSLLIQTDFGTNLVDLMSSKSKIIDELMKGLKLQVGFNLVSKLDDMVLSIIQYYEELQKKSQKENGKKKDDPEKVLEKQQKHMLHLLSVLMKTKMSASFELDYIENFQNNFLSLIGDGQTQDYLNTIPADALPFLADVKEEFEKIQGSKEGIPEVVEPVSEIMTSFMEGLGLNSVFSEMINFINDNINENEKDEEDDKYPDTRIAEFMQEICQFILECFDEKLEIMFFFKTCFLNLSLRFKEFRNALFATGKAYQKFNEAQGGDKDGDDEDY